MNPERLWCLEFHLQPLSELLIRQVGKSNVQWFSYPFLPPTTFSGFIVSLLANEGDEAWKKNYVEINDENTREVGAVFPEVISVGAYPDPVLVRRSHHYRQHLGDIYNYEEFAWKSSKNKKLAMAEAFWTPQLRGFLLASGPEALKSLKGRSDLLFRSLRVGKKGVVKVEAVIGPYELTLQSVQERVPSTIAPLEMIKRFPKELELFHVPMRRKEGTQLVRETYPCVFGLPIWGQVYVKEPNVVIPDLLIRLVWADKDKMGHAF